MLMIDINKMLDGLAYQHLSDHLTTREKVNQLRVSQPSLQQREAKKLSTRKIALLCEQSHRLPPIDYAIDVCQSQGASLELLMSEDLGIEVKRNLMQKAHLANISCDVIDFGKGIVQEVYNYLGLQRELIFLVARPKEAISTALMERLTPRRGSQSLFIPLVLVEGS